MVQYLESQTDSIFSIVGYHDSNMYPKQQLDDIHVPECLGNGSKRIRLVEFNQLQALANEESSPLHLRLRKSQSFLDLLEKKLAGNSTESVESAPLNAKNKEKTKASNFPALRLRIGCWERVSRYEGDLVGKLYYAKRKLVWEVLDSGLKSKIEIQWSDIIGLRATFRPNQPDVLEIELNHPPAYHRESNPQPRKHTLWHATDDFTGGQAPRWRRHYLECPEGTLEKHYGKLLQFDNRLSVLSRGPFPTTTNLYFNTYDGSNYDRFRNYCYDFDESTPGFTGAHSREQSNLREIFGLQYAQSFGPTTTIGQIKDDSTAEAFNPQRSYDWVQRVNTSIDVTNRNREPTLAAVHAASANCLIHSHHLQNFSENLLHPTNAPNEVHHSGSNLELNEIERLLLRDPVADEQRLLPKVDPTCNLLNVVGVGAPLERIGGDYVHTNTPSYPYMSTSSVASGPSEFASESSLNWLLAQEAEEDVVSPPCPVGFLPNVSYAHATSLNYVGGQNFW